MVNPFCVTDSAGPVRSVLLPLDGSETSEVVLDPLIPLARSHGSRLTLLFVDWEDPTLTPEGARKRRKNRERDITEWLSEAKARLEEAGLPVEIQIAHGDVAQEVLRLAEAGGEYDLVAMGTHGRSGPGRWLLGSIAEKVLRECRLPVLLARKASSD
jgi:nucleotide-binding universal stress UspA family protein